MSLFLGLLMNVGSANQPNQFLTKSKTIMAEKAPQSVNSGGNAAIKGEGRVRNLKVALVLSPDLAKLYEQMQAFSTKKEQLALLDNFLWHWVKADKFTQLQYESDFMFPESRDYAKWNGSKDQIRDFDKFYIYDEYFALMNPDAASIVRIQKREGHWLVQDYEMPKDIISKIQIINAFSGLKERQFYFRDQKHLNEIIAQINQTYDAISFMYYLQIANETRLAKYIDLIGIDLKTFELDYSKVLAAFEESAKNDLLNTTVDLYEFLAQGYGAQWPEGSALLNQQLAVLRANDQLSQLYEMINLTHLALYNYIGFKAISMP